MNIIMKIFLFVKNIFVKQDEVKKLQEPEIATESEKKESFIESLKIITAKKTNNKKVETLTCNGDGLGIQKKISC